MRTHRAILMTVPLAACAAWGEVRVAVSPDGTNDSTPRVREAVRQVAAAGGGVVGLAPGDYHFRDCLTSSFQYCDALVSIHPEVKDLKAQRRRYHRNVVVEDNEIETFDVPLLYALSAENVTWRRNRVTRHDRYRSWGKPAFQTEACESVRLPPLRAKGTF